MPFSLMRLLRTLRRRLGPAPTSAMTVGIGTGLRFDAGPSNPAYATGANEKPVQAAVAAHLKPGGVFVDVGANVGFFTVLGARLVGPSGKVIAFEPVPANAALARRNAAANGFDQVAVIEKAVADRDGSGRLVLAEYSGGSALDGAVTPPDAVGELAVQLTTLDTWLAETGAAAPDLVKIDVEGAEMPVLAGMAATLRRARPVVIVELDAEREADACSAADRCRAYLEEFGYHVGRLEDSYPEIDWHVIHLLAVPAGNVTAG